MKVFKTEEQADAACNKASELMQKIAQHNGKSIAKSDCPPEYTEDIATALNTCLEHLRHASCALDEIDSAATNFEDVEFELLPIIEDVITNLEHHPVWDELKFDASKEAERYFELHDDEAGVQFVRKHKIGSMNEFISKTAPMRAKWLEQALTKHGTQPSC